MVIPRRTSWELSRMVQGARRLFGLFSAIGEQRWDGRSTMDVDRCVRRYLQRYGLVSALVGYRGYPAYCSVSVNSIATHGVPDAYQLRRGDIFTVDVAARAGGWITDSAWTFRMPGCSHRRQDFHERSWQAFRDLLRAIRPGMTLAELAFASGRIAESCGLAVIPEFVGHGIGRELHEPPAIPFIPQLLSPGAGGIVLSEGMTVNIEPVYTCGPPMVVLEPDGWAFRTQDRSETAHFELTVAIGAQSVDILQFDRVGPEDLPKELPFGLLSG